MSQYNITVTDDILVSIEFLDLFNDADKVMLQDEKNFWQNDINIAANLVGSKSYVRDTSQSLWEKIPMRVSPGFWMTISY